METSRTTLRISKGLLAELTRTIPRLNHETRLYSLIALWNASSVSQRDAVVGSVITKRKPGSVLRSRGGAA